MGLQGKIALVTGGSRGIGRATVLQFARAGAHVVACTRRHVSEVNSVVKEARHYGVHAHAVQMDVRKKRDTDRMVRQTLKRFDRIDVLVNNAGMGIWAKVEQTSEQDFDEMVQTNLKGVFLCTKAVLPTMIKQKYGVIINVSSVAGRRPIDNMAVYCATKYALDGFSFTLAREVKEHNIRVGVVYPGMVDTHFRDAMTERRTYTHEERSTMLTPDDVARAITFMAGQEHTSSIDTLEVTAPLFGAPR